MLTFLKKYHTIEVYNIIYSTLLYSYTKLLLNAIYFFSPRVVIVLVQSGCGQLVMVVRTMTLVQLMAMCPACTPLLWVQPLRMQDRLTMTKTAVANWP